MINGKKAQKAQVSVEFVIMTGVILVSFIIMLFIYIEQVQRISRQREVLLVEDLAFKIQKELIIAGSVIDGYYRQFIIPDTLDGVAFSITRENNTIVVESEKQIVHRRIPSVIGEPIKGANKINKTEGVIYLN